MKPYLHAQISTKKWGGTPEEYLPIHDFLDSSKSCHADMRHRAILHSSFGCYLAERVFGHNLTLSTGRLVSVRDVAEQHCIDDLGRIPSVGDYLNGMPFYDWLGGTKKTKTVTPIQDSAPSLDELRRVIRDYTPDPVLVPDDGTIDNAHFMPRLSGTQGYLD